MQLTQLPLSYKTRPLNLYLLRSGSQSLLIDTGDAATPTAQILPFFQKLNFNPQSLTYILITHPDVDHSGGVHAMRQIARNAQFLCGTLDRDQIETPEGLADLRAAAHFHYHGLGLSPDKRPAFLQQAGGGGGAGDRIPIARTFHGNETLTLADAQLHILHLPGHSLGHLGIYLPDQHTAIIGDAVHHTANFNHDGTPAFAPTYMYIDAYLGTIAQLEALRLHRLYSAHWPNCETPQAVQTFLAESRAYCLHAEHAILNAVRTAGPQGITAKDLIPQVKPQLGSWPSEKDAATANMLIGHLQRLTSLGLIRHDESLPTRYYPQSPWKGLR
jgi:glyoxylase-like metal-dependent hydrolase (beta-lactamase superfamily II)